MTFLNTKVLLSSYQKDAFFGKTAMILPGIMYKRQWVLFP